MDIQRAKFPPLLRSARNIFGYLGMQLHPIDSPTGLLILTWNLTVISIMFYSFYFEFSDKFDALNDNGNAFIHLFNLIDSYLFESTSIIILIFLLFNGRHLIQILNNRLFFEIFRNKSSWITYSIMIYITISYPFFYYVLIKDALKSHFYISIIAYYFENFQQYFYLLCYYYVKHGTYHQLSVSFQRFHRISTDLHLYNVKMFKIQKNCSQLLLNEWQKFLKIVRQLSIINENFTRLFSRIFLLQYLTNVFDLIMAITSQQVNYQIALYYCNLFAFIIYIVYLDLLIKNLLKNIEYFVRNRLINRVLVNLNDNDHYYYCCSSSSSRNVNNTNNLFIKLYEMNHVYLNDYYYSMNLSNYCQLSFEYVLDTIGFIFIYTLIIIQTQS